jgi:hypothetical protein
MITSTDLEQSLSDSDDVTSDISSSGPDSVIDSTPQDLNTEDLLQATAQESARLASTYEASAGEAAAASTPSNDSRGSLEGVPTTGDSNAAAAWDAMLGAKELTVPGGAAAAGCRPPTPNSKLVGATASITSLDPDAPLREPAKTAITELDSSVKAVQPVDSYEDMFEALAAAAAVAATSSMDGHDHGREGSAAKGERAMQLVSAEQDSAAAGGDGEGTGTWTGGAAAAAPAADSSNSGSPEPAQRATEGGQEASAAQEGSSSKKELNWFQRLLGGGWNEGEWPQGCVGEGWAACRLWCAAVIMQVCLWVMDGGWCCICMARAHQPCGASMGLVMCSRSATVCFQRVPAPLQARRQPWLLNLVLLHPHLKRVLSPCAHSHSSVLPP